MRAIIEGLEYQFNDYINNGLVIINETNSEISVTVKSPSEFNDVYDDWENSLYYVGKGHQKCVKRTLKSLGFSFDGSGIHIKTKITHNNHSELIPIDQINKGNYKGVTFMNIFIENNTDDNGMVDISKLIQSVECMKDDWNHNLLELNEATKSN